MKRNIVTPEEIALNKRVQEAMNYESPYKLYRPQTTNKVKSQYFNNTPTQPIPDINTTQEPAGLAASGNLLDDAIAAQKQNQENVYRNNGINMSKNTGDTVGRIFNILFGG